MRNIIIATNYSGPYEGNFVCSIKNLAAELKNSKLELTLIFPIEALKYEWVRTLNSWCKSVFFINTNHLLEAIKVRNIIINSNALFIHTHFATFKMLAIIHLAIMLTGKKIPVLEHWHNHWSVGKNLAKECVKKLWSVRIN